MSETLLELVDVSFSYDEAPFALKGVSLAVGGGERIAVLGCNGAGKSTFFLLCNGVHHPSAGSLAYRGETVTHKKRDLMRLREQVGIVFQDPNQQLIGSTVEAEVSFGPMNLRLAKEEVAQRTAEALAAMEIEHYRERPPHYLSGGEKKRVSIADVLAMRPEIILFDEPTASLDPAGVAMLEGVLEKLSEAGKTLLVSTHDLDFAWRWADRGIVFAGGEMLADAPLAEIFADEALLARAGLRKPLLFDVACALRAQGLCDFPHGFPKTSAQLGEMLKAK